MTEDVTNQAQVDPAADNAAADVTNRVLNPESQDGAKKFEGFATKDGEVISQDGNPMNTSTEKAAVKPAAKTAKPAAKDGDEATRRDPQKRIDQAVAKQRAAERRADDLLARITALEAGRTAPALDAAKTATTSENVAPDPAKYQYGEADARYIRDLSRFETLKTLDERDKTAKTTAQQQAAIAAGREKAAAIDAWADKAPVDKYDDFHEVVIDSAKRNEWPLSETLGSLIQELTVGYDIAYALASDPKEAIRISRLSAARQAAWFGTEEARLMTEADTGAVASRQQTPVRVSSAPVPPQHIAKGSGKTEPVNGSTTSFADFEKLAMQK